MSSKTYSDSMLCALFQYREEEYAKRLNTQKLHAQIFEQYDISHTEFRVLARLMITKGEEPSVLADSLSVLRQTMTKVIDSLENKGFVKRTEHPTDRRRLFVIPQPAGLEIAKKMLSIEADFTERVEARLSPEDSARFRELSGQLREIRNAALKEMLAEREEDGTI